MSGTLPPESNLTRRTITGMLWMAWANGAHALLQMVILAVMARFIAPAEFGVVSAALVVVGFSTIISQIGLGPTLVQRPKLEQRHIDTAFTASVILGVALGVLLWALAPAAETFFRAEGVTSVLRALAFLFPLYGLATVPESLVKRELRFRWLANLEVSSYALGHAVIGISLALLGWGIWALVIAELSQTLARTALLLVTHPPRIRALGERRALGELLYFSGGFTLARLANFFATQGDNLVVGRTLGPAALGFYGRAYQLMNAPATNFGGLVEKVLFPTLARVQSDAERLSAAYRRGIALVALVVLPPSAALILLAPELIAVLLGPAWMAVVVPFQILAVGMLFRTSYKISDAVARSTGAVYQRAWRQFVYAGLVLGGAWLGGRWGIAGVATGVLASVTINFLLMSGLAIRVSQLRWRTFLDAHLPALRTLALLMPVVWASATACRWAGLSDLWVLLIPTAAMLAIWGTLAWRAPAVVLGADGSWILRTLRGFVARSGSVRADSGAPSYRISQPGEAP